MVDVQDDSRVRVYHIAIFPEEYDFQYDSIADALDRDRGISPMSREYIELVNVRRRDFGFEPINGVDSNFDMSTYNWVKQMLRDGREDALEPYINRTQADSKRS